MSHTSEYRERVVEGYVIPIVSHDGYKRLYSGTPFDQIGDLDLHYSNTYAFSSTQRLNPMRLASMAQEYDADFVELFARLKYIPNGQLKNFLVACRTFWSIKDGSHIAVVGSKSQEGSGVWHKYLAFFLAEGRTSVSIDFIDPNETEAAWETDIGTCHVSCRWIPDSVKAEDLSAYDAVSSDVWNYATKRDWGVPPVPIYSLKGGMEDYTPFAHFAETRFFSSPPSGFRVKCPCITCTISASCVQNWKDYVVLRTLCARLGCPHRCRGINWVYDNNMISEFRQEILTGGGVDVIPSNYRYIMALSLEEAISIGEMKFVKGTKIRRLDPRTSEVDQIRQKVYTGLEGKSIVFAGVDPGILGSVRCTVHQHVQFGGSYDVMFTSNVTSWSTNLVAPLVYCAERPDIVEKVMVGWKWSGSMISEFYEYREDVINVPKRVKFLESGRIMSIHVSRGGFRLSDVINNNLVYANGLKYCLYDPKIHRDDRSLFTGAYYKFEQFPDHLKKYQPFFPQNSHQSVSNFLEFSQSKIWGYAKRVRVQIYSPRESYYFIGSCPADFLRDRGLRLYSSSVAVPLLCPFETGDVYYVL